MPIVMRSKQKTRHGYRQHRSFPGIGLGWWSLLPILWIMQISGLASAADPIEGQMLARQWCTSCHAITPGQAVNEQAPSFAAIVRDRGRVADWLNTWLATPHEWMPDFSLSRQEIEDLVAYLESLR